MEFHARESLRQSEGSSHRHSEGVRGSTARMTEKSNKRASRANDGLSLSMVEAEAELMLVDDTASEAAQNLITEKNAQRRYGRTIEFENYMCSHFVRLLALLVGIMIIPLQLFMEGFLKEYESENVIQPLQTFLVEQGCNKGICNDLISLPIYLFNERMSALWMILLSLCTDSLLGFKSTLLTCFGMACMSVFNTFYKDARPFWKTPEIDSFGHCSFDFASPDTIMFIITFFYGYNLLMYRFKFSSDANVLVNFILVALYVLFIAMSYFAGVANGQNYLY